MADRDQILVDFQAFTGIEDFDQCRLILESHDWDLSTAVQNAMTGLDSPQDASLPVQQVIGPLFPPDLPDPLRHHAANIDAGFHISPPLYNLVGDSADIEPVLGGAASALDLQAMPGPSFPPPSRLLNFNIEYKNSTIILVLTDSDTVGRIKQLIEEHNGVPCLEQRLSGWQAKQDRLVKDSDILRDLLLPKDNVLYLFTDYMSGLAENNATPGEAAGLPERLAQTFTLNISYIDKVQNYKLDFPGSRTVREIKGDIYSLTDIPVRHQVWQGWPSQAADEDMTLAGCGITYPSHNLEVSSSQPSTSNNSASQTPPVSAAADTINISDDEFEDAQESMEMDEDIFTSEDHLGRRQQPLMPSDATDQTGALEQFSREFAERYGDCHPVFYLGSLESALKDSLQTRAVDRKLLAIYLHHDNSILANVFCSQVLCQESIVNVLSNNFITWSWDLTSEANRAHLLTMCTQHFGSVAASTVRKFKADELPLLLIISRNRSINEVVNVIQASVTVDELMTQLIQASENFQGQLQQEIVEEGERDEREQMKRDQDEAYQESLQADRAKEVMKQQEEAEQRQIEEVMERALHEEEERQRQIKEEKEATQLSLACALPEEPPADCQHTMARIRFRLPGGEILTRRFLGENKLQILLNFVSSKGFSSAEYKVLTTFPRRDLAQCDSQASLQELKLCPQETVMLEQISDQED